MPHILPETIRGKPVADQSTDKTARQRVIDAVRAIPEGFVRTYGDISPGAPRFTGTVLRTTDEDLPWWRVVRADGSLAQGERQRALLDAEGVPFLPAESPRVDLRVCQIPHDASAPPARSAQGR